MEQLYIKNIENAISSIRLRNKKPNETSIGINLNKLKLINEGMASDLLKKYKSVLNDYKRKK